MTVLMCESVTAEAGETMRMPFPRSSEYSVTAPDASRSAFISGGSSIFSTSTLTKSTISAVISSSAATASPT